MNSQEFRCFRKGGSLMKDYNEHEEYDEELPGTFLINEPDDITLIMMPKLDFNLDKTLEEYYEYIKKCKNKNEVIGVLKDFYEYISTVVTLINDIQHLQDRAKELEFNIQLLSGQ